VYMQNYCLPIFGEGECLRSIEILKDMSHDSQLEGKYRLYVQNFSCRLSAPLLNIRALWSKNGAQY
jgi:hypothetical protein